MNSLILLDTLKDFASKVNYHFDKNVNSEVGVHGLRIKDKQLEVFDSAAQSWVDIYTIINNNCRSDDISELRSLLNDYEDRISHLAVLVNRLANRTIELSEVVTKNTILLDKAYKQIALLEELIKIQNNEV